MQGTLAFKQKGGSAFMRQFTIAEGDHHNIKSGDHTHRVARSRLASLPREPSGSGQRQLISLVLWKLLASSTHAIAGALETMAKRLQGVLD